MGVTTMKALFIYPKFPPSYWSFERTVELIGAKALLPPLGLITVAAILPQSWEMKLVDCNIEDLPNRIGIGMMSMVYNMRRLVTLHRMSVSTS